MIAKHKLSKSNLKNLYTIFTIVNKVSGKKYQTRKYPFKIKHVEKAKRNNFCSGKNLNGENICVTPFSPIRYSKHPMKSICVFAFSYCYVTKSFLLKQVSF